MGAGELFLSSRSMTLYFTFLFLFWVCWEIKKKMHTATDTRDKERRAQWKALYIRL